MRKHEAVYDNSIPQCTVTFKDGLTEEVIDSISVDYGNSISQMPIPPEHEGYTFSHWEGNTENITADTVITAVYTPIASVKTGDLNGDGEVTTIDAILLLRKIAGWNITIDEAAGDINGDGTLNTLDALLLLRHIAGWNIAYFN